MIALTTPQPSAGPAGAWRWDTRRLLAGLRDQLLVESPAYDGWLAARGEEMTRQRDALLARLAEQAERVLHQTPARSRPGLERLLLDVDRHLQRRRDLAWDEVELELGGSE